MSVKSGCRNTFCSLIVAMFIATLFTGLLGAMPPAGGSSGWLYRRAITVDHTKVGSDQTDFPVLIDITNSDFATKAQSNGNDFYFATDDQTRIPHQIELYDSASGHLVAWVKVPSLSSTTDTTLYMYYGNPSAPDQENSTEVWGTHFKMVQHLNEKSGPHYDSTANHNDGTPQNIVSQGNAAGMIDGADKFNGKTSYVAIPHNNTISGFTQALTVEAWVRIGNVGKRQIILNKYNDNGNQRGWSLEYYYTSTIKAIAFFASPASSNGTSYKWWYAPFSPQVNAWYDVAVVWQSNTVPQFYINGLVVATVKTGLVAAIYNNTNTPLEIGRRADVGRYFNGTIDEVRISDTARSATWISTSFTDQNDPSSFYTVGPEVKVLNTPPIVSDPSPAHGAIGVSYNLKELTFVLSDPDSDSIDYSVTMNPDDIVGPKSGTGVASGTKINITVSLQSNTSYTWEVQATDPAPGSGETTTETYTFKTSKAGVPTQDTPLLKASSPANSTHDYLTCYNQSTSDPDGDPVTNIYAWYKNDSSLTGMLMPFDTQSSTVAKDYSGYSNDGSIHGATWTSNGIIGGAYRFDGINDYIEVPDQASLGGDGTWAELSIEFWIKVAAPLHGPRIVAKRVAGASSGSYTVGFQTSASDPANTLFFGVTTDAGDGEIVCYDQPLAVGKWYHVVCTYKSGIVLAMYINGSSVISTTFAGKIIPETPSIGDEPVFIGSDGSGDSNRWLNGTLDDVRIYNKALTSEQASQRYSESKDGLGKSATIVPQQTSDVDMEVWKCEVTPNDGKQDGEPKFSNSLTVQIYEPLILNENPLNGTSRVPVSLSELSFYLQDYQNNRMNYTVTTIPNIGSGSGKNVANGRYHIAVSGLKTATTYTWQVNVTDGINWTNSTYQFSTPVISQKWAVTGLPSNLGGVIIANFLGGPGEQIIHAGIGRVTCLNGTNGNVLWTHDDPDISIYCELNAIDLNKDGVLEIVVPLEFPPGCLALYADGRTYWRITSLSVGAITSHPVIGDVDGDGYPTIFLGTEDIMAPYDGAVSAISYNGKLLNQTWCYRPCSGGFSLADADKDGTFELFMGDRASYDGEGAAQGPECWRVFSSPPDRLQFVKLWSRPDLPGMFSSHCPILVDYNNDGKLEVVVENQRGGLYILNATSGKTIKGSSQLSFPAHYQPSVCDVDGDGHLEILGADGSHSSTPNDIRVWDLVTWQLEARMDVGLCYYPPQEGNVTGNGDGLMDIIACNYTGIFIFHYNRQTKTYDLVDAITSISGKPIKGKLNYAVVQDIDGDGLYEMVVENRWGMVYAFDTPALRPALWPALRPRSEVQFYSECRRGVAEYVPYNP